jgi:hypothetical protein
LLALLLTACSNSDSNEPVDPTEPPDPADPHEVEMTQGEAYDVSPNDRLVTTSPEPAKISVNFRREEETADSATLLEGEANLYR